MHVSLAAFGLHWLLLWTPVISADNQVPVSGSGLRPPPPHKYVTARNLEGAGLNRTVDLVCVQARLLEIPRVFIEILGYPLADA